MFDDNTFDSRHSACAAGDDSVIGLIAEFERREKLAIAAQDRADTVLFALPEEVRMRRPRILVGICGFATGEPAEHYAHDEAAIDAFFRWMRDDWTMRVGKTLGMVYTPKAGYEELVAELQVERARVEAAYEKSGHAALEEPANALDEEVEAVLNQIEETPPVTYADVEALLKFRPRAYGSTVTDDVDAILDNVLTWLLAFAREAQP